MWELVCTITQPETQQKQYSSSRNNFTQEKQVKTHFKCYQKLIVPCTTTQSGITSFRAALEMAILTLFFLKLILQTQFCIVHFGHEKALRKRQGVHQFRRPLVSVILNDHVKTDGKPAATWLKMPRPCSD